MPVGPDQSRRCGDSPTGAPDDSPHKSIHVDGGLGSVNVAYDDAHFRCDQTVEGFLRTSTGQADFLVQPTDMNPASVADCDCLYDITMLASVPPGRRRSPSIGDGTSRAAAPSP